MRALRVAAVVASCTFFAARAAHADPSLSEAELATARALFTEGLAREDAKDWAGALARFESVLKIRTTPQVVYNIALCNDRLGKYASADKAYAKVANEAAAPDLAKLARARRAELASQIPEGTLTTAGAADADLSVTVDGAAAALRAPFAIDPGDHEVVAKRHGNVAKKSFSAKAGKSTVAVPIPTDPPPSPKPAAPGAPDHGGGIPTLAFVTGGAAIVALGVAGYGFLARGSAESDLDAVCGAGRAACPDDSATHDKVDKVGSLTTLSNVGLIAGAALAATTVVLVIVGSGSSSTHGESPPKDARAPFTFHF